MSKRFEFLRKSAGASELLCQQFVQWSTSQTRRRTLTSHNDEFPRTARHDLLLEKTQSTALDEVQLVIYLVGAIKCHVQQLVLGDLLEGEGGQAGAVDEGLGALAGGDELDLAAAGFGGLVFDGIDDVLDGAAGADADVGEGEVEILVDGLLGGGLFGLLDEVGGHGGVWAAERA